MKKTISACYICLNENNKLFECSIRSVLGWVDEVVVIDGGSTDDTLGMLDSFHSSKIKVYQHKYQNDYEGADGRQRNNYLTHIKGDWAIVVDCDEVIDDNGYLIKDFIENADKDVYDVHMKHFMWDFVHEDATLDIHWTPRRLFKNKSGLFYDEVEHPVLKGCGDDIGKLDENIVFFHYSDVKGNILRWMERYYNNIRKSNMHTQEYLKWWRDNRLYGTYPTKRFIGMHPKPILMWTGETKLS